MPDNHTIEDESWDCLPHQNWANASQILNDEGWFSEYSGVPFFVRSLMRRNREKILHKLAHDADLEPGALEYLETIWSGAAGWVIYRPDVFPYDAAKRKLEAEIHKGEQG